MTESESNLPEGPLEFKIAFNLVATVQRNAPCTPAKAIDIIAKLLSRRITKATSVDSAKMSNAQKRAFWDEEGRYQYSHCPEGFDKLCVLFRVRMLEYEESQIHGLTIVVCHQKLVGFVPSLDNKMKTCMRTR